MSKIKPVALGDPVCKMVIIGHVAGSHKAVNMERRTDILPVTDHENLKNISLTSAIKFIPITRVKSNPTTSRIETAMTILETYNFNIPRNNQNNTRRTNPTNCGAPILTPCDGGGTVQRTAYTQ